MPPKAKPKQLSMFSYFKPVTTRRSGQVNKPIMQQPYQGSDDSSSETEGSNGAEEDSSSEEGGSDSAQ